MHAFYLLYLLFFKPLFNNVEFIKLIIKESILILITITFLMYFLSIN